MAASGALLVNWLDLDDGAEPAFELWHNREHVAERLVLPGFVQCRRYVSSEARPAPGHGLLILYDAYDAGAFASPAYAASLDAPTQLTTSVVPRLRRVTRAILEIEVAWRAGLGGWLASWALPASQAVKGGPPDLSVLRALSAVTAVTFARRPGTVADAKAGSVEEKATETVSAEIAACLLVEASRPEALAAAASALAPNPCFAGVTGHCFQLAFAAQALAPARHGSMGQQGAPDGQSHDVTLGDA